MPVLKSPGRFASAFVTALRLLVAFALGGAALALAHDEARMQRTVTQRFGADGARWFSEWRSSLLQSATAGELEKLRRVNEYFNRRIAFQEDIQVWQQVDYWATPLETVGRGMGDCEDFAIAKYFSLIEIGVPAQRLRLTYVRAQIGAPGSAMTQAHMVVSYYATPEAEPLVLDNLIRDIRPASRRPDLTPVFSFNSQGVWMAGAANPTGSIDRLSRWKDLMLRMSVEGYEPLEALAK